jgi:ribosomal protein L16 Arg81 hydroxylase
METREPRPEVLASGTLSGLDRPPSRAADLSFDLERLLHPVDPGTFKTEYWEKRPLVISRKDCSYYQPLLSLSEIDYILAHSRMQSSDIRIVRNGQETPVSNLMGPGGNLSAGGIEAMYQAYRKGSTIVLLYLQERWPPLRRLCQSLAVELSAGIQVNVYLTPPNARGLQTHYDTHDVFVLQTHGAKRWRIYHPSVELPLLQEPYNAAKGKDPGEPLVDTTLNSGELIYIPRGYLHDALSLESTSLHLTVGIKPVTWATVILSAIQSVINQDSRLRESLPPGFAADERLRKESEARLSEIITSIFDQIRPEAAIDDARNGALLARYPSLEGHLLDLEAERLVSLDTSVRRRADIQCTLTRDTDYIYLHFHGKIVRMPAHVETDLRFIIAETGEFTADDLPGELDSAGRVLLVRRLLKEGFLTIKGIAT